MAALSELKVLVVEDSFLQANYAQRELEGAGARVIGPCQGAGEALQVLSSETVDCALLDVNVDDGVSYDVARALIARNSPVVFLTGYGDESMPDGFQGVARLQKPVNGAAMIAAIARACGRT
ncbi:MAG TPA: response regulator [Caulobacteraceae bacterium]|nr:response regulator [Caulobacteraceae bacterium]